MRTSMKRWLTLVITAVYLCLPQDGWGTVAGRFRILHLNDFHGFAEPHSPLGGEGRIGGAAWLAARIQALREEADGPVLLLAAGDMIQGNNWTNLDKGAPVIAFMNRLRFDAMALGNHEFDFGREVLGVRAAEAAFPLLAANVHGLAVVKPFAVFDAGGIRVGVIGVVTEDTPVTTNSKNVIGLTFDQAASAVRIVLPTMREKADVVVVLAHLGHDRERELAAAVPGVDIIIGGHSHTRVDEPPLVGTTLVAQAWEHGKALGIIEVTVAEGKVSKAHGRLVEIRPDGEPDREVAAMIDSQAGRIVELLGAPVGETQVDLDGEAVRVAETNLGNFVADALRQAAGAEAALINGGSIRTSIRKGMVAVRDVYGALPFDNYVVAVRLTGEKLRQALEHGVSAVAERAGRYPQVSGIAFTFDPAAPAGARIGEVRVGSEPLDGKRIYTVATNDFLVAGGDGYSAFSEAVREGGGMEAVGGAIKSPALAFSDPSRYLRDVVVALWKEAGTISPVIEGRSRMAKR